MGKKQDQIIFNGDIVEIQMANNITIICRDPQTRKLNSLTHLMTIYNLVYNDIYIERTPTEFLLLSFILNPNLYEKLIWSEVQNFLRKHIWISPFLCYGLPEPNLTLGLDSVVSTLIFVVIVYLIYAIV